MNQPKEILNSAMNQINLLHDDMQRNLTEASKKAQQMNPWNSMQFTWQSAQARKQFVFLVTLPFVIGETFWNSWLAVFHPDSNVSNRAADRKA